MQEGSTDGALRPGLAALLCWPSTGCRVHLLVMTPQHDPPTCSRSPCMWIQSHNAQCQPTHTKLQVGGVIGAAASFTVEHPAEAALIAGVVSAPAVYQTITDRCGEWVLALHVFNATTGGMVHAGMAIATSWGTKQVSKQEGFANG